MLLFAWVTSRSWKFSFNSCRFWKSLEKYAGKRYQIIAPMWKHGGLIESSELTGLTRVSVRWSTDSKFRAYFRWKRPHLSPAGKNYRIHELKKQALRVYVPRSGARILFRDTAVIHRCSNDTYKCVVIHIWTNASNSKHEWFKVFGASVQRGEAKWKTRGF